MENVIKHFESGTVQAFEYKFEDKAVRRVRNLIMDLWENMEDEDLLKNKLVYTHGAVVNDGFTLDQLIKEFSEEEMKFKNELVFVEAGRLEDAEFKTAEDLLRIAANDVRILKENNFANILFLRRMGLSYGVSFYYILKNDAYAEFVEKYKDLIIKTIVE